MSELTLEMLRAELAPIKEALSAEPDFVARYQRLRSKTLGAGRRIRSGQIEHDLIAVARLRAAEAGSPERFAMPPYRVTPRGGKRAWSALEVAFRFEFLLMFPCSNANRALAWRQFTSAKFRIPVRQRLSSLPERSNTQGITPRPNLSRMRREQWDR